MTSFLWGVFVASLVGSPHCAGMCGPLVLLASATDGNALVGTLRWHGGRLLTYLSLGALAGSVGDLLNRGGGLVGLQRTALILGGGGMVLIGLRALLLRSGWLPLARPRSGRSRSGILFQTVRARASKLPARWRTVGLGMASGFLPCGWLYAFIVTAAASGRAMFGLAILGTFWVGTLPFLSAIGMGSRFVATIRRRVPVVTELAFVLIGVTLITGRVEIAPPPVADSAATAPAMGVPVVPSIDSVSCCHDQDD